MTTTHSAADIRCPHCSGELPAFAKSCHHCGKGLAEQAAPSQVRIKPMGGGATSLIAIGIAVVVAGLMSLTPATMGVGLIGIACFLGIWARILQAGQHHTTRER